MFEEYKLTNLNQEQKDELPEMVRIGSFQRKTAEIPAFLPFSEINGFCFEINSDSKAAVHNQMQYIALSILMQIKPELIRFTFVDIGISTSFPLIHRLKHPDIKFITNKNELKNELKNISDTARYISTSCLGYDFKDLKEYNEKVEFKEPYHLIFIANFPKDFKEDEIDLISTLIKEANPCGIHAIISYNESYSHEINTYRQERFENLYSIPEQMINLDCTGDSVKLKNFNIQIIQEQFTKYQFSFENYNNTEIAQIITHISTQTQKKSDSSENFISIPIGRSGRQEVLFEMGEKSDTYHALIAGRTRTGKSTLLNSIITRIAELYSPDEIRLFLLDYKQGVEFQMYENHPNVEVLLLDNSKFEYGVQQLQRFRDEIVKRAKLFSQLGSEINSINEYNKKSIQKLPRLLLIIDEVQQLFTAFETRKLVNPLVKEIAKQGAGFGIHMLFSSQSYVDCKIDDDTLSQMNLRIAFNLANGRECRAILGGDNDVPIKLEKFHAVFNYRNGDKDFNQIVKLYNFEKGKIAEILENAVEKYQNCMTFQKTIKRSVNFDDTPVDQPVEKKSTEIKTVKRDCKYKTDIDL